MWVGPSRNLVSLINSEVHFQEILVKSFFVIKIPRGGFHKRPKLCCRNNSQIGKISMTVEIKDPDICDWWILWDFSSLLLNLASWIFFLFTCAHLCPASNCNHNKHVPTHCKAIWNKEGLYSPKWMNFQKISEREGGGGSFLI